MGYIHPPFVDKKETFNRSVLCNLPPQLARSNRSPQCGARPDNSVGLPLHSLVKLTAVGCSAAPSPDQQPEWCGGGTEQVVVRLRH